MNIFDRYAPFKINGKYEIVPFIPIRKKKSDKYVVYNSKSNNLDKISYEYYESPDYTWLILQANPELSSIEHLIPNGTLIRVPYPLSDTLNSYLNDIIKYKEIN